MITSAAAAWDIGSSRDSRDERQWVLSSCSSHVVRRPPCFKKEHCLIPSFQCSPSDRARGDHHIMYIQEAAPTVPTMTSVHVIDLSRNHKRRPKAVQQTWHHSALRKEPEISYRNCQQVGVARHPKQPTPFDADAHLTQKPALTTGSPPLKTLQIVDATNRRLRLRHLLPVRRPSACSLAQLSLFSCQKQSRTAAAGARRLHFCADVQF